MTAKITANSKTNVNAQIEALASMMGVEASKIRTDRRNWLDLMKDGVLVNLHVNRWRGQAALDYDDLGIPLNGTQPLYDDLVSLGSKTLLPMSDQKKLDSMEVTLRRLAKKHGWETAWGDFIPATGFAAFKAEFEELAEEWRAYGQSLADRYEDFVAERMDKFSLAAREAFRRHYRLTADMDFDYRYLPEDAYVDQFLARIKDLFPTAEEIAASFKASYELRYIPLPSLIAAEEAEADRIRVENIVNREIVETERRRQEMVLAMQREVAAQAAAEAETQIFGFLKDIAAQVRTLVYEAMVDIEKSVAKNGRLHGRSVVQVRNLIERVQVIAEFSGDKELPQMIEQLRQIADRGEAKNDEATVAAISEKVKALKTVTLAELAMLGETGRIDRSKYEEVPTLTGKSNAKARLNVPTPEALGTARRSLNLNGSGKFQAPEVEPVKL